MAIKASLRSPASGRGPENKWCPGAESNHRHCDFQSHALPTELPGRQSRSARAGRESAARYRGSIPRCLERRPGHAFTPIAARNRFLSTTPSRSGSTRGGSSAAISTRANRVPCKLSSAGEIAQGRLVAHVEAGGDAAGAGHGTADPRRSGYGSAACRFRHRRRCRTPRSPDCPAAGCRWWRASPCPINISPSPVTTATRRLGCASARPSPIMAAPPIAPQR